MPVEMQLWQVNGEKLSELGSTALDYERRLQTWICEDSSVQGMDLAVIGREVNTGFGRIDVLAAGRDGEIVIVEIKRDRTPRDVVAQTLEYASWVSDRVYEVELTRFRGHLTMLEGVHGWEREIDTQKSCRNNSRGWFGQGEHHRSWRESSSHRRRRFGIGSSRRKSMREACPRNRGNGPALGVVTYQRPVSFNTL